MSEPRASHEPDPQVRAGPVPSTAASAPTASVDAAGRGLGPSWLPSVGRRRGGVAANGSDRLAWRSARLLLVFGIFVADPILLAVLVLPGSLLIQRVGGSSTNLSVPTSWSSGRRWSACSTSAGREARYLRQFLRGDRLVRGGADPGGGGPPQPVRHRRVVPPVLLPGGEHPGRAGSIATTGGPARPSGSTWGPRSGPDRHRARRRPPLPAGPVGRLPEERHRGGAVGRRGRGPAQPAVGPAQPHSRPGSAKYLCLVGLLATQSRQSRPSWWSWPSAWPCSSTPTSGGRSKLILASPSRSWLVPTTASPWPPGTTRSSTRCPSGSARSARPSTSGTPARCSGEGMRFYNLPQYITVTAPPNVLDRQPGLDRHRRVAGLLLPGLRDDADHVPAAPVLRHPRTGRPARPLRRRPVRHLLDRGALHHARS